MKLIFFGTDDFALTVLGALVGSPHDVAACVTQPDRARDRGQKVRPNAIKVYAQEKGLPVFQPDNILDADFIKHVKALSADFFVVVAYGRILPAQILSVPKTACLNIHASLLPKYRGAAPINWALINGEARTGVTLIEMNERMDAGDIVMQSTMDLNMSDDAAGLRQRLAVLGAEALLTSLDLYAQGKVEPEVQDESRVVMAPKLTKDMGNIDWSAPAATIHNLIRGLLPRPAAFTFFEGKRVKILKSTVLTGESQGQPGTITAIDAQTITVATGEGQLSLLNVQPDSAKAMTAAAFAAGYRVTPGSRFSSHPGS